MKRLGLFVIVSGLIILYGFDARAARKGSEVGTHGQSAPVRERAMRDLYARLTASPRPAQQRTVELTAEDASILANPGIDSTGRFRVGVHGPVGWSVSRDGDDLIVRVPGASAIRLELTTVTGTVAVFNDAGQAHEYREDGFTHSFWGDEVRVRGSAHIKGVGALNLGGNLCSFNAACIVNAECVSMPAEIARARDAYASILFISGRFYYICSGGLIADSDPSSEIPYFLTANHCVSSGREAKSLETFFQYVQTSCTAGPCSLPDKSSTIGSTIVATNGTGDYTFLQLAQAPPAGSVFLGWNDTPVAFDSGVYLYRISHPGGAPQAYSIHEVDASAPTCRSWPRGSRIYSRDRVGATEGGSSGSPVLNDKGEVVGQLSGACGYNVGDDCDAVNNATVDGAFAAYYPEVAAFLGDGSGACSADAECDDGNLCTTDTCDAGTCSNTPLNCDDGIDCTLDSCDSSTGQCVSDDSQCRVCLAVGASCSADNECCSGKCRGKSGGKSCK